MPNLIIGLFLLYLVLIGIKQFARLSPTVAARLVRPDSLSSDERQRLFQQFLEWSKPTSR